MSVKTRLSNFGHEILWRNSLKLVFISHIEGCYGVSQYSPTLWNVPQGRQTLFIWIGRTLKPLITLTLRRPTPMPYFVLIISYSSMYCFTFFGTRGIFFYKELPLPRALWMVGWLMPSFVLLFKWNWDICLRVQLSKHLWFTECRVLGIILLTNSTVVSRDVAFKLIIMAHSLSPSLKKRDHFLSGDVNEGLLYEKRLPCHKFPSQEVPIEMALEFQFSSVPLWPKSLAKVCFWAQILPLI